MQQEEAGPGGPLGSIAVLRNLVPFEADAVSDRLGWAGLEAVRYRGAPTSEIDAPPLTHHTLILFTRPPEGLELRIDGMKRHLPPPVGSISLVPAGSPVLWRWSGRKDSLHVYLEPGLVARVAAEVFELDAARMTVGPLDALDLPLLRSAMLGVNAELTASDAGGGLVAESLANVLAVHLIRHVQDRRPPASCRDGTLPQARLRAVVEYIEGHLEAEPTLEQMAAVAHLSPYHFARQFKRATGVPPHQYVIVRRVDRAKQLMQEDELSLAQVATSAGFSDQSHLSRHFKRIVGVTPGQFRLPARMG